MKKKLKPQVPAEGIMKTSDFGNSKTYRVECVCAAPDDSIDFMIIADEILIEMVTDITSKSDWNLKLVQPNFKIKNNPISNSWLYGIDEGVRSFINGLYCRLKITFELWTKGYITYHHSTAMTEQQALNFSETIRTALHDVDTFQKERMKRWGDKGI